MKCVSPVNRISHPYIWRKLVRPNDACHFSMIRNLRLKLFESEKGCIDAILCIRIALLLYIPELPLTEVSARQTTENTEV
jgi:hypothetical protein